MNTYDEYDVDDDLPAVNTSTTTAPITNVARISKRGRDIKDKEEEAAKTIRKPRPKLDFNRLLKGSRGLGYLAVCTKKNLKLSGKPGTEANDLSQICVYLQEWAKKVFPKLPLMEFLLKVEEICQSRLMKACVPQILARLKEMGEDANIRDLETVESEVMARLATTEAERAMESISAGLEVSATTNSASTEALDFNIDEHLIRNRSERVERSERTEYTDDESEEEDEDDEEEYAKEMNDFINDRSDESEREVQSENDEEEAQFSDAEMKPSQRVKRGITFNFSDDDEEVKESESEAENVDKEQDVTPAASTIVNDEVETPVKKRNIAVIMDSDSD